MNVPFPSTRSIRRQKHQFRVDHGNSVQVTGGTSPVRKLSVSGTGYIEAKTDTRRAVEAFGDLGTPPDASEVILAKAVLSEAHTSRGLVDKNTTEEINTELQDESGGTVLYPMAFRMVELYFATLDLIESIITLPPSSLYTQQEYITILRGTIEAELTDEYTGYMMLRFNQTVLSYLGVVDVYLHEKMLFSDLETLNPDDSSQLDTLMQEFANLSLPDGFDSIYSNMLNSTETAERNMLHEFVGLIETIEDFRTMDPTDFATTKVLNFWSELDTDTTMQDFLMSKLNASFIYEMQALGVYYHVNRLVGALNSTVSNDTVSHMFDDIFNSTILQNQTVRNRFTQNMTDGLHAASLLREGLRSEEDWHNLNSSGGRIASEFCTAYIDWVTSMLGTSLTDSWRQVVDRRLTNFDIQDAQIYCTVLDFLKTFDTLPSSDHNKTETLKNTMSDIENRLEISRDSNTSLMWMSKLNSSQEQLWKGSLLYFETLEVLEEFKLVSSGGSEQALANQYADLRKRRGNISEDIVAQKMDDQLLYESNNMTLFFDTVTFLQDFKAFNGSNPNTAAQLNERYFGLFATWNAAASPHLSVKLNASRTAEFMAIGTYYEGLTVLHAFDSLNNNSGAALKTHFRELLEEYYMQHSEDNLLFMVDLVGHKMTDSQMVQFDTATAYADVLTILEEFAVMNGTNATQTASVAHRVAELMAISERLNETVKVMLDTKLTEEELDDLTVVHAYIDIMEMLDAGAAPSELRAKLEQLQLTEEQTTKLVDKLDSIGKEKVLTAMTTTTTTDPSTNATNLTNQTATVQAKVTGSFVLVVSDAAGFVNNAASADIVAESIADVTGLPKRNIEVNLTLQSSPVNDASNSSASSSNMTSSNVSNNASRRLTVTGEVLVDYTITIWSGDNADAESVMTGWSADAVSQSLSEKLEDRYGSVYEVMEVAEQDAPRIRYENPTSEDNPTGSTTSSTETNAPVSTWYLMAVVASVAKTAL